MASLYCRKNNNWCIQFKLRGERRTLSIGPALREVRMQILVHVESLVNCQKWGMEIPSSVNDWLAKLDVQLLVKLHEVDLLTLSQLPKSNYMTISNGVTIKELTDYYEKTRGSDWKESTKTSKRQVFSDLLEFFPEPEAITSITPGCIHEFRTWLKTVRGIGNETINKRLSVCKSIFQCAVEKKWLKENPFDGLKKLPVGKTDKMHFVSVEASKLIAFSFHLVTGDPELEKEFSAVFSFYRWGGLRADEPREMRWEHLTKDTFRVVSTKTDSWRTVPLFPELLYAVQELRGPKNTTDLLFPIFAKNSRSWFSGILKTLITDKLGIYRWRRLLQNLRATRSTEILNQFGPTKEAAWLGHSAAVSQESYQMVPIEHTTEAANWETRDDS